MNHLPPNAIDPTTTRIVLALCSLPQLATLKEVASASGHNSVGSIHKYLCRARDAGLVTWEPWKKAGKAD